MTRLEHANLVLNDIAPTLAFLKAAFPHWKVRAQGSSPWYGKPRNWLHFGDDYTFVTLNDNGEGPARDLQGHSQGLAHIGFSVTGLDRLVARLKYHGYCPRTEVGEDAFRRNIYFIDPAGIEFEFVEYSSDNPVERNADTA